MIYRLSSSRRVAAVMMVACTSVLASAPSNFTVPPTFPTGITYDFKTSATGLGCSSTTAAITGTTYGGKPIAGSDSIQVVGCT